MTGEYILKCMRIRDHINPHNAYTKVSHDLNDLLE